MDLKKWKVRQSLCALAGAVVGMSVALTIQALTGWKVGTSLLGLAIQFGPAALAWHWGARFERET